MAQPPSYPAKAGTGSLEFQASLHNDAGIHAGVVTSGTTLGERSSMNATFRAVLSPCIGICSLRDDGLCEGCHRTTAEIARWSQMGDDERMRIMEVVLPSRELHKG